MTPNFLSNAVVYTVVALALAGCARKAAPPVLDPMASLDWTVPSPPAPSVVWVSAGPYRKASRAPGDITAIVIHTTEGRFNPEISHEENQARNFAGVVNYFKKNDRNVSAHYVMGPKGEICQMVNETDIAHTQTYYNGRAFGIECAGWSSRPETWTPELMDSLVELCAYLCVKWEIPPYHPEGTAYEGEYSIFLDEDTRRFTAHGLVGHFQVQPWNKTDPGPHFPWEEFSQRVRDRIAEFGVEPAAMPTPEEIAAQPSATARIEDRTVTVGVPFTYALILQGEGVGAVEMADIVFPDFTVLEGFSVTSEPQAAEVSALRAVYEIGLTATIAGSYSIQASRAMVGESWKDSQTVSVKVEPPKK